MKLDEKLIHLRKEKGLTQLELAEAVKVSRQAVSKWESGGAIPSTDNLRGLSDLFGVPVDFLLNDGEEKTREVNLSSSKSLEDTQGMPCRETRKLAIKWGALILAFIILALSIWLFCSNKNKKATIGIEEMFEEEVEPNRNFNVGW